MRNYDLTFHLTLNINNIRSFVEYKFSFRLVKTIFLFSIYSLLIIIIFGLFSCVIIVLFLRKSEINIRVQAYIASNATNNRT